jgi:Cu-Zn family superoxide dismutase
LVVGQDGKANYAVLAPRLKISDIKSRALIIHVGGDNYSDDPALLGGGGARIACGAIKG